MGSATSKSRKSAIPHIAIPKPNDQAERETVIQYDNGSNDATVYTWDTRINTYMTKIGVEPVEVYTNNRKAVAWKYVVPKRWAVVRRPKQMPKREGNPFKKQPKDGETE